ncbi:hypothetical protein GY45DRAFT_1331437 [Cubamyces sp. BRFM 1775]|nr:hypothetical protein GY45DRAFT_1331437 [Cubamyces sp. BRFM 1775]
MLRQRIRYRWQTFSVLSSPIGQVLECSIGPLGGSRVGTCCDGSTVGSKGFVDSNSLLRGCHPLTVDVGSAVISIPLAPNCTRTPVLGAMFTWYEGNGFDLTSTTGGLCFVAGFIDSNIFQALIAERRRPYISLIAVDVTSQIGSFKAKRDAG